MDDKYVPAVNGLMVWEFQFRFMIGYDIFIKCNWVVTWWQYTLTHKRYREQHK